MLSQGPRCRLGYRDNLVLLAIIRHVTQGLLQNLAMVPLPAASYTIPLRKQTRLVRVVSLSQVKGVGTINQGPAHMELR